MATIDELHQALIKADAAGNTEDAKALAAAIRQLQSPVNDMSGVERFAAGAGKAVADTGLGLRQLAGGVMDVVSPRRQNLSSLVTGQKVPSRIEELRQEVDETRLQDAPLMNTGSGMAGNVAGNLAMALLPGGVLLQGGKLLTKVPGAARMAEALMTGGRALVAPKTIPGAAATGAVQGAIQPSTSTQETLMNAGVGGAAGAAIPALVRGGQVVRALTDPFSDAGQARIIGRAMNNAAGNDSAIALQNMRNAQPLVPGSLPTAGQAASNPGIAALERTATATDPVAMNEMARRLQQQSQARSTALQGVAPDRAAAVAAREAATSPLYRQAYSEQLAVTPELQALLQRPSMEGALSRAQSLAKEQGQPLSVTPATPAQPSQILNASGAPMSVTPAVPASMTGRDAHLMKMGLDDMANASPMSGIGGNELRAIQGTRGDFLTEVEKQIPAYGQARQTYAQMSRPVTQADVVADIAEKANFRGDLTPAAFARALRDETAQRVTGQANATMAGVMEPSQMQTLDAIRRDLLRSDFAQTAGKGVGSDTVQKLAFSNLMDQAGVPSFVRALPGAGTVGGIAQRVGKIAYQDANEAMRTRLAQALLNPQDAAALMEAGVVTPQMQMLLEGTRRGGAALGVASPYLLNATKE